MASLPESLTSFAGRIWLQFRSDLPAPQELARRLMMKKQELAQRNTPFEDPCTSCDGMTCWLLDHQERWNELLNPAGPELRCYAPGRLSFAMLPVSVSELPPSETETDFLGNVLLVLWLLNNHRCVDRVQINTDVVFGDMAEVFYRMVQIGPHVKLIKVVRWLLTEGARTNDEIFSLRLASTLSLESVSFSGLQLSQFAMANMCQTLFRNANISHVSFRNLTMPPESAQVILAAFNECQNLKTIEVDFRVTIPGVPKALNDLLTLNTTVLEFSYEVNTAIRFPFKDLSRNRTLKTLSVGRFVCVEDDIASLGYALRRNKHLRVLRVPVCTSEKHSEQWSKLTDGLAENVGLVELDLHRSIIGDKVAELVATALLVNKTLRKVNVGTNSLTGKAAASFAEALVTNTVLEELRLGRLDGKLAEFANFCWALEEPGVSDRVYAQFCPALISMLIRLARGKHLLPLVDISGEEPSPPEMVDLLSTSIRVHTTLTGLRLTLATTLTSRSAQCLATLFKESKALKRVELSLTVMGLEVRLLSEGLQESTSILTLRVKSWCFDDRSAKAFVKMLSENCSITHLLFFKPTLKSVDIIPMLRMALTDNHTLLQIELFEDNFLRVIDYDVLPILRRNYARVSKAAAFFQGTLSDQGSAVEFKKLASSTALMNRIKEATGSLEEDIATEITKKLQDLSTS